MLIQKRLVNKRKITNKIILDFSSERALNTNKKLIKQKQKKTFLKISIFLSLFFFFLTCV